MMESVEKQCSKCKKKLIASRVYFYKSPVSKDGFTSYCKDCQKRHSKSQYKKRGIKTTQDRVPYDSSKPEMSMMSLEKQEAYEKYGVIPVGFYPCRVCNKLKANLKARYPYQPRAHNNEDGSRRFTTVCRSCRNYERRRKQAIKDEQIAQDQANMCFEHDQENWETVLEVFQEKEAAHYEHPTDINIPY